MKRNGSSGFAIVLIACGALILFGKLGFVFGHLFSYLVPLAMVGLGYYSIRRGSKFIGWAVMILGALILFSKFNGIIGLIIAIGLIVYGVSMLRKNNSAV